MMDVAPLASGVSTTCKDVALACYYIRLLIVRKKRKKVVFVTITYVLDIKITTLVNKNATKEKKKTKKNYEKRKE